MVNLPEHCITGRREREDIHLERHYCKSKRKAGMKLKSGLKIKILILLLGLHACLPREPAPELMDRFTQYYESEKKHAWSETYKIRTPKYRETVRWEYYAAEMEADYSGFELLNYEITGFEIHSDEMVTFRVKFTHTHPAGELVESGIDEDGNKLFKLKYTGKSDGKISNIEANSVWQKIDGIWYCRDAAMRMKLSLNADVGAG
jgi:hypothetical protein